jgi:hypothetical protein
MQKSKLIGERIRRRARGVAVDPVRLRLRVELSAQGVAACEPHSYCDGGKNKEIDAAENERIDYFVQHRAESHPGAIQAM